MSRTLKVYAKYRCQKRRVSVYDPQIKLQGQWLSEAGIKPGDRISIEVKPGEIVIRMQK